MVLYNRGIKKSKKLMILKFLLLLGIVTAVFFVYKQIGNKRTDKAIDVYLLNNNLTELYKTLELTEHSIERAGCSLHFYQYGDKNKPLIILLHAAFSDHNSFFKQYEALSQNYLVVGLDIRAHGKSQPVGDGFSYDIISKDIKAIIDFFNKPKASLIGVSIGGELIQEFNYMYPDMLTSVVIVGSVSIFKDPGSIVRILKTSSIKGATMFDSNRVKRFMARNISNKIEVMAKFYKAIQYVKGENLQHISKASAKAYRVIDNQNINVPVLLMHGEEELGFAKKAIEEWAIKIPNCKYKIIKRAGHLVNQENPDDFNKEIVLFFNDVYVKKK